MDAFAFGFLSMTAAGLSVEFVFRMAGLVSRQYYNLARDDAPRMAEGRGY